MQRRMVVFGLVIFAWLGLSVDSHAQGVQSIVTLNLKAFGGTTITLPTYSCPSGMTLSSISSKVCIEPVRGSCTVHWCVDPTGNRRNVLASSINPRQFPNPNCRQDPLQISACTNAIPDPDKDFIPSPRDLVSMMPMIFPQELLKASFDSPPQ